MAITRDDIAALTKAYLDCVMVRQEPPPRQQEFFLHQDPILFLLRGEDMTLQQNYELHQKLTDEKHWSVGWDVTHLCDSRSGRVPSARSTGRRASGDGPRPSLSRPTASRTGSCSACR